MNKARERRSYRFDIRRRGELVYEHHRFICLIHDISEEGIFVICNYYLEIGQELEVRFELEPGLPFEARIRVRHFDDGYCGAEILKVDSKGLFKLLGQFFDARLTERFKEQFEKAMKEQKAEKLREGFAKLAKEFAGEAAKKAGASVAAYFGLYVPG